MKWRLFIYRGHNKTYVAEMDFNHPKEIEGMLELYEGFWCRIIDLSTLKIILEGAFDESYLDEAYYR
jgi:hypothetical protein